MELDYKQYFDMTTKREYIDLYQYYMKETFLDILGVSRIENPHSSFLSWLLNINASHDLDENALRLFISSLCMETPEKANSKLNAFNNKNSTWRELLKFGKYEIDDFEIATEIYLNKKRVDLLASFIAKFENDVDKRVIIILENKVSSKEHNKQTEEYFNGSIDESERQKMLNSLYSRANVDNDDVIIFYVFLSPLNYKAVCTEFININYQLILDNVLEPCLYLCNKEKEKSRISDYIRCLGQCRLNPNYDSKNYIIMAISSKEISLVKLLLENHKDVMESIINSIIDPNSESLVSKSDIPFWESVANVYAKIYAGTNNQLVNKINNWKNTITKHEYFYNNQFYQSHTKLNIGRLHRDIIAYVFENCGNPNEIDNLRKGIVDKLSSNWLKEGILSEDEVDALEDITDYEPSKKTKCIRDFEDHYFVEEDLIISYKGKKYYVARYWDSNTLDKLLKIIKEKTSISNIDVR